MFLSVIYSAFLGHLSRGLYFLKCTIFSEEHKDPPMVQPPFQDLSKQELFDKSLSLARIKG